jgi:hypothetical protein
VAKDVNNGKALEFDGYEERAPAIFVRRFEDTC